MYYDIHIQKSSVSLYVQICSAIMNSMNINSSTLLFFLNHKTRSWSDRTENCTAVVLPLSPLVSDHCRGEEVSGWHTPHLQLHPHQLQCTCIQLLPSSLSPTNSNEECTGSKVIPSFLHSAISQCKDVLVKLHSLAACVTVTYVFPAETGDVPVAMKMWRQELSTKGDSNDWSQSASVLWQTAKEFYN